MLKTNKELLKEKIAYADKKIECYMEKINELKDVVFCNRTIINNLIFKRKHAKVVLDAEKNEAKVYKSNSKITDLEKELKQENLDLAIEIEKTEEKLKQMQSTRKNLVSILNGTKKRSLERSK